MSTFSELVAELSSVDVADIEHVLARYRVDKFLDASDAGAVGYAVFRNRHTIRLNAHQHKVPEVVAAFFDLVMEELSRSWLPACDLVMSWCYGIYFWDSGINIDFAWPGGDQGYGSDSICTVGIKHDVASVMLCGKAGTDSVVYNKPNALYFVSDPNGHIGVAQSVLHAVVKSKQSRTSTGDQL